MSSTKNAIFIIVLPLISTFVCAIEMPEECQKKGFCTVKPGDYPQALFNNLLSNVDLPEVVDVNVKVVDRLGVDEGDNVCQRDISYEPVYQIIDRNDQIRYVAQLNDKFVQKMRIEECKKSGPLVYSPYIPESVLTSFNVTCVESRMDYKFLVLSSDQNSLEPAFAKGGIPICCSCIY